MVDLNNQPTLGGALRHDPVSCEVCAVIQDNPTLTNTQLAYLADTSDRSIRRHKKPNPTPNPLPSTPEQFFTDVPTEIVTSRGRSILTPDGSWEKITYRPQDMAVYEAFTFDDVEKAIAGFVVPPAPTPIRGKHTAVLCLSDFQLGKVDENGGTPETLDRILRSVEAFCTSLRFNQPAHILMAELGDLIEGFDNTGTQRATNDQDLTTQIRTSRRLLIEIIMRVSKASPGTGITFLTVPSNHCQVRVPGKDLASTPNNDWGVELNHQLEDVLHDRPEFAHVKFLRPANNHAEAVVFTTPCGVVVGAVHGHQSKSPDKVGTWWTGQSHGRRNGLHTADILLHGHYHSLRVSQSGDSRWVIGTPSADNGSAWFTNKTGETSVAGILAFDVQAGQVPWFNLRLL